MSAKDKLEKKRLKAMAKIAKGKRNAFVHYPVNFFVWVSIKRFHRGVQLRY